MKINILKEYLNDLNQELYGRDIARKIKKSQKATSLNLIRLENEGILKSRKVGTAKLYKLNKENMSILDHLLIAETQKKLSFIEKNRIIMNIFKKTEDIIIIFGSYARGEQDKYSDVDILVISGKKDIGIKERAETFLIKAHIIHMTQKDFEKSLKNNNNLIKNIVKHHIIIDGSERFLKMICENYYGFDKMV